MLGIGPLSLACHRGGADGPLLILAHGLSDDGLCWGRVAETLGARYRLLAFDARGHGQSEAPAEGYRTEDFGADLLAVLEAEGRPAIIFGHSLGAEVATWAAARRPELVCGLVLEDPPWNGEWLNFDLAAGELRRQQWLKSLTALGTLSPEQSLAQARRDHPGWHELELVAWAVSKRRFRPQALGYLLSPRPDYRQLLASVRCPALLLTGSPDLGALVDEDTAVAALVAGPTLKRLHLPGAGHCIHRDRFADCLSGVEAFLATV
jgi:N-formylmaleamate deformylase